MRYEIYLILPVCGSRFNAGELEPLQSDHARARADVDAQNGIAEITKRAAWLQSAFFTAAEQEPVPMRMRVVHTIRRAE